jgi:hypothetical protein
MEVVGLVIADFEVVCLEGQRKITRYFVLSADNHTQRLSNMWNSYTMYISSSYMAFQPMSRLGLLFMRFRNLALIDNC